MAVSEECKIAQELEDHSKPVVAKQHHDECDLSSYPCDCECHTIDSNQRGSLVVEPDEAFDYFKTNTREQD